MPGTDGSTSGPSQLRAARTAHAVVLIEGGAVVDDHRHAGEGEHVVDDRRLAEQAFQGRERRLRADHAALAFQALQQRSFLAADIGAGSGAHFHVVIVGRVGDAAAEHAALPRFADGDFHRLDSMRIFGADIDVAIGGTDCDSGDGHAFDQNEGITFHDHAVGEGA